MVRQAELAEHYPSVRAEVHPTDLAAPGAVAALWETLDAGCCPNRPSPQSPLTDEGLRRPRGLAQAAG